MTFAQVHRGHCPGLRPRYVTAYLEAEAAYVPAPLAP